MLQKKSSILQEMRSKSLWGHALPFQLLSVFNVPDSWERGHWNQQCTDKHTWAHFFCSHSSQNLTVSLLAGFL